MNPEFLDAISNKIAGLKLHEEGDYSLGLIPSPHDFSHLKGRSFGIMSMGEGLPASYDLRALGKLTPVRDQGSCGSCWSFATYGSLESTLMPSESWDFSENNLKNTHGFDWGHCSGGNADMSTAYLARWNGPIQEADDPYNPSSDFSLTGLTPVKHFQAMLIIPNRASALDNDNLKQAIMMYGAVYTSIYWNSSYYQTTSKSYYYNGTNTTNHALTIVGWDDNYSRYNFSVVPPGNGAFIIRNSWGTWWGDNGYFYISYYDSTLVGNRVFLEAEPSANYSRIYQYDQLGWVSSAGCGGNTAWFANVFTASAMEQLAAVSFYNASPESSYEIYIYTDVLSTPITGSMASSKNGIIPSAGYHTIVLDVPVALSDGQRFSAVVKLTTPGFDYPIPRENPVNGYTSAAHANAGESFVSCNGSSWSDITDIWADNNVCIKAFTANTSCAYAISPASRSFPAESGTGNVSVATQSGCAWTAVSNHPGWITVTGGSSGTGSGTVSYSVSANTSASPRSGTMTIAGHTFTVTQAGVGGGLTNILLNPDFESGPVSWTEYSSGGYEIITEDAQSAHEGNWYAWMGGFDNATEYISQDVAIPSDASQAYVQFWYAIGTQETTTSNTYDTMAVEVRRPSDNALLTTLVTLSNLNETAGWIRSSQYNVIAYKGQTIRLRFYTTTDSSLSTVFVVDTTELSVATAQQQQYTLTVNKNGTGSGTVTASGCALNWIGNIGTCTVNSGTSIALSHYASDGSGFAGWSGICTGMESCVVNMTEDASVRATFQVPTFRDVPPDHWAFGWIEMIYANGITTGYSDDTYRPTDNVTRAQMAVFIIKAKYGDSFSYNSTPYFSDVPSGHWAFKYIQKMYEDGITTGYSDGTYRPAGYVTRGQMAAFIARGLYGEDFPYNTTPYFIDVPASHGSFKYIQKVTEEGIASGYPDGTYRPSQSVNRAQMAAFIAKGFLGME
jgi:C1A family cysteine protease